MSTYLSLKNKIPQIMHNDYWLQVIETIADEIDLQREDIALKQFYNDIDVADYDRLLEIAFKYGYTPNLALDNSLEYLRKEVRSIVYKIKKKTTLRGYIFPMEQIEREGNVFNIYYEGTKLIRALDIEDFVANTLPSYGFATPITIPPTLYYSTLIDREIFFDEDVTFDEDPTWEFDSAQTTKVTKHLGIEIDLDTLVTDPENSIEYLLYENYFKHLDNGTLYNKKGSTSTHTGANLSLPMDDSGYFNQSSGDPDYSIPLIKLRNSVTPFYREQLNIKDTVLLDDSEFLDNPIIWRLDQNLTGDSGIIDVETDFKYITMGTGGKGQLSTSIPDLYCCRILHYGFDEPPASSTTIFDSSANGYDTVVTGTTTRKEGILGMTVDFDGATSVQTTGFLIGDDDTTTQFWLNVPELPSSDQVMLDTEYLKVTIKTNGELDFMVTGTTGNDTLTIDYTSYLGLDIFIQAEMLIGTPNTFSVYFNAVLEDLLTDIDAVGGWAGAYTVNIGWDGTGNYLSDGILFDDFSVHAQSFTLSEKEYFVDNRLGSLLYMETPIFRQTLSENEKYEDTDHYIVQGYLNGNTVNDEVIGTTTTGNQTFTGSLEYLPIMPKNLKVTYTDTTGATLKAVDDGVGNIVGDSVSGTIDYITGEYSFSNFIADTIYNEVLHTGSVTNLSEIAENTNITVSSITMYYTYNGVIYSIADDGAGAFLADANIDTSSINYVTGAIDVDFNNNTDSNTNILITYEYTGTQDLAVSTFVYAEYKVTEDIEITELAIENSNRKVMAYATFPPIKFGDIDTSYLSANFIIKRL